MPVLKIHDISSEFRKKIQKFKNISFILENTKYAFFLQEFHLISDCALIL